MFKYLICSKKSTPKRIILRDTKWIEAQVAYIRKNGLEEKILHAKRKDEIFIVQDKLKDGTIITHSFICTNDYQGRFVATITNSGYPIKRDTSLEVCFEE